jgi:hypothetical protein
MITIQKEVSTGEEGKPGFDKWTIDVKQLELGKDITITVINPEVPFKDTDCAKLLNSKWSFDQMNTSRRLRGQTPSKVEGNQVIRNLMSPPVNLNFATAFLSVFQRPATIADAVREGFTVDGVEAAAKLGLAYELPAPTPPSA